MKRTADISKCGAYRWTLSRVWDDRPMLVVVMFNPSTADAEVDDPTISLLSHIASHNGYGGMVVMNLIPLRDPFPQPAIDMANTWHVNNDWSGADALLNNVGVIVSGIQSADAILLAWGALGGKCAWWTDHVHEEIRIAAGDRPVYCLAVTKAGYPKHPLARGKHKVPKTAPLIPFPRQSSPRARAPTPDAEDCRG